MSTFEARIDTAELAAIIGSGDVLYLGERGDVGRNFQTTRHYFLSPESLDGDELDLHHLTWVSRTHVEYACGKARLLSDPVTTTGGYQIARVELVDDATAASFEPALEEHPTLGVPVRLRELLSA